MINDYAGWKISDDKQREIEAALAHKVLVDQARANGNVGPGWLRIRMHHFGIVIEQLGARLQVKTAECTETLNEALGDEPRMGASI